MSSRTVAAVILACLIGLWAPAVFGQCMVMGEYTSSPPVSVICAGGSVHWEVDAWVFESIIGEFIRVWADPGPLPELLGSVRCADSTFLVRGVSEGDCTQWFELEGRILSEIEWFGTFSVNFSFGSCEDCVSQTWDITGAISTPVPQTGTWGRMKALYR